MKQYIDKDAVIAKINGDLDSYDPNEITSGRYALVDLRNFINGLEVKVEDELADTFIEKACEWLINHNDYICGSTNGIVKYDMKQLVDDFKKYMKGE